MSDKNNKSLADEIPDENSIFSSVVGVATETAHLIATELRDLLFASTLPLISTEDLVRRLSKKSTNIVLRYAIITLMAIGGLAILLTATGLLPIPSMQAVLIFVNFILIILFDLGKAFSNRQSREYQKLMYQLRRLHPELYPDLDSYLERLERV